MCGNTEQIFEHKAITETKLPDWFMDY